MCTVTTTFLFFPNAKNIALFMLYIIFVFPLHGLLFVRRKHGIEDTWLCGKRLYTLLVAVAAIQSACASVLIGIP